MADLYKGILGPMRGKIDGLVGRYMYGKALLQSKGKMGVVQARVELTPAQETMQLIRKVAYCAPKHVRDYFYFLGARIGGVGTAFIKANWSNFEGKINLLGLPNNMMRGKFGTLPYTSTSFIRQTGFVRFQMSMSSGTCPWQGWYGQIWVFDCLTGECVNSQFPWQLKSGNSLTLDTVGTLPNGEYLILVAVKRTALSTDMYSWATVYKTLS